MPDGRLISAQADAALRRYIAARDDATPAEVGPAEADEIYINALSALEALVGENKAYGIPEMGES